MRISSVASLWLSVWRRMPSKVRKTIVATIGATLIVLAMALVVLPGPFTIPLLVAGFAVLGTEFAWAARTLERFRAQLDRGSALTKAAVRRLRGRRPARRP